MPTMKWVIPTLMILAACAEPASEPVPAEETDTPVPTAGFGGIEGLERPQAEFEVLSACLSEEQQALVGQPVAQARATLPPGARFIGPDEIFTQDYRPTRPNADYNAQGVVTRVWCG